MQGKERTAIEISSASPAVLSPISAAANPKVYGGGRLPPGFSFDENGELVHAPARESRSDFYLGRMTKTTSSASTRSRPEAATPSLSADMVAGTMSAGLRLLNPAPTCAALGEARHPVSSAVVRFALMRAVVVSGII